MGWAHAGQEQESRCWRGSNTPVPSSLTNGVPLVSHPGMGWNRKALGSVMKHCGSPAQDHFLRWLLNCCLGRIYFRELLRDPAPTEILIAFENPGFCWWHFSGEKCCILIKWFWAGITILCWSQLLVLCSRGGRKSWHWVCRLAVLQSSY